MNPTTDLAPVKSIINSDHGRPSDILGAHPIKYDWRSMHVIRAYRPDAKQIFVIDKNNPDVAHEMQSVYYENFFEVVVDIQESPQYFFKIINYNNDEYTVEDPYNFPQIIGDMDLHLFGEGNNNKVYEILGAHPKTINGISGYHFAVWAPNAVRVSVIGDFNYWDGRYHLMNVLGNSGIWELFIPGITNNMNYKFEVKTKAGHLLEKVDPYGYFNEVPPKTSSVTYDLSNFDWDDEQWMSARTEDAFMKAPISIYEVHLGSWMRIPEEENRYLTYKELAHKLVDYVLEMGYTHIELLPVAEHPFSGSWGYQITGYYAVTSRFGDPHDFMYFVNHCHKNNIGVLIDWVPGHFPKDGHGLAYFDGTPLYEHEDPRLGEHKDWGTLIFNYGRNEIRNFLIANALFWLDKYHIDGLRVDAVASMLYLDYSRNEGEWIPNYFGGRENLEAVHFIRLFNKLAHHYFPGVLTIAEESTAWGGVSHPTYTGGLGFSLKWNMGWMNDFLEYISKDPIHRKYHHEMLTFALLYAFTENFVLVLSHDEVVHGKRSILDKMPGNLEEKFANARLLHGFMCGHPGKKLIFQGAEIGQWTEWNHNTSIEWHLLQYEPHQKLQKFVKDINNLYKNETALHQVDFQYYGFEWIDFHDWESSIISFIRKGNNPEDILVFVFNFTPVLREHYRIGVPQQAFYKEIINSDSEIYGGGNRGNNGGVLADNFGTHNRPFSIDITLPPLGMVIFKPIH
ncbi:MAG: 1,4-alpha-glucan branching enzyme [Candidatus Margulisiibacteriota bacterium]|nr:MAG: 1,4-alpha-glucan branching enzyme [Candidatus Margulisbacteria bacterium GWD2_39_127]OGI03327.1 MAG: 1,4-alpha-glucan branching enzyme [Candidatus Margulisbacteria bacterium GWF2_38_17]OGI12011.1 MAG: 1,4-alpha-glucan branching enzyme [Candidatus Margulisbacteria bacterium GWE2_39_32]PZM77042.1 MAG: 1,4-alpha-glucan branching enzyme [Candidatus Margulisiibacteriota bacterium]HAR63175.1 1,4-alpha-glucan branching enzyme [Candidatus Margulisiibacteriota bacterium]